jgi:RecB family exonuclease
MEAAGHVVDRVEISPDGRIVVIPVKSGKDAAAGDINEWDADLEDQAALHP